MLTGTEREAPLAAYFGTLLYHSEFIPSLDPPSEDVNSAKLERHLGYTAGLVAVLTARPEGPSPHILFEISMCLRARKPLLAFLEDNLPDDLIPRQALHRRFSARSYVRETREHMHALQIFRTYIGESPVPRYQPPTGQRSCMLVGLRRLSREYAKAIRELVIARGYSILDPPRGHGPLIMHGNLHYAMANAALMLCLVDDKVGRTAYLIGATQAALIPTIPLTTRVDSPLNPDIPSEYQRRVIPGDDISGGLDIIRTQIERFEEDFIELDKESKADRYAQLLAQSASSKGQYTRDTRITIVQEVTMGDKYVQGQGIQGRYVQTGDVQFTQLWDKSKQLIDLNALGEELGVLREELHRRAKTVEEHKALRAIAEAETAAKAQDGPRALRWLAAASRWAFDAATEIGIGVAVKAIQIALGLERP